jgi:hypothetical protein
MFANFRNGRHVPMKTYGEKIFLKNSGLLLAFHFQPTNLCLPKNALVQACQSYVKAHLVRTLRREDFAAQTPVRTI